MRTVYKVEYFQNDENFNNPVKCEKELTQEEIIELLKSEYVFLVSVEMAINEKGIVKER